jgi:hypothetical protein
VVRDLRDPTELGLKALELRRAVGACHSRFSLVIDAMPLNVKDYANSQGPIEKYGDPRKIPSTMPNAVE